MTMREVQCSAQLRGHRWLTGDSTAPTERALGASEGTGVGISVGLIVACDGTNVGASDGVPDGWSVGGNVCMSVGTVEGWSVGSAVGSSDGGCVP